MRTIATYLFFALIIFSFSSCSENLDDDNTPALQAVRNGEFFKSATMSASLNNDGTLSIFGQNAQETVEFELEDDGVGIYRFGAGSPNEAIYTLAGSQSFSTAFGNSTGELRLTSVNTLNGVTGTFSFVSYLPNNADSLYMRRGVIYKVPFGEPVDNGGNTGVDTFTAVIDGTPLNATIVSAIEGGSMVVVSGANATSTMALTFPNDIVVGSYPIAATGNYTANYISGGVPAAAISGTLEIASSDVVANTVSGTFNFVTGPPDNFVVTNGTFSVSY
jgi:hypothetical protein